MFALKVWSYSTGSLVESTLHADFATRPKSPRMKGLTRAF
jgi:hypothetical protein